MSESFDILSLTGLPVRIGGISMQPTSERTSQSARDANHGIFIFCAQSQWYCLRQHICRLRTASENAGHCPSHVTSSSSFFFFFFFFVSSPSPYSASASSSSSSSSSSSFNSSYTSSSSSSASFLLWGGGGGGGGAGGGAGRKKVL